MHNNSILNSLVEFLLFGKKYSFYDQKLMHKIKTVKGKLMQI